MKFIVSRKHCQSFIYFDSTCHATDLLKEGNEVQQPEIISDQGECLYKYVQSNTLFFGIA